MAAIRKERVIENAYFQVNYKTIEGFSSLLNRKTAVSFSQVIEHEMF